MNELLNTRALLLKSVRFQESSKILTFYSREAGRISVIAKGVLRPKSPFGGKLETLRELEIILAVKENRNIQTMTEVEIIRLFHPERKHPDHMIYALAILELIDQTLAEGHTDPVFYDFLQAMLASLEEVSDGRVVLWYFLLKLCSFLGFRPRFSDCQSCRSPLPLESAIFSFSDGTIYCSDCSPLMVNTRRLNSDQLTFLHRLQQQHHQHLPEFNLELPGKHDYTEFLTAYLNHHLDHPLHLNALEMLPAGR